MARRILVTGASKGIGRAIARQLAVDGFEVGVHYGRDRPGAEETLAEITSAGGVGHILGFDVANRTDCQNVLNEEVERNGAYYGVVLNAGIARDAAFPALRDQDWDDVLTTNLDGFYNVLKPLSMAMIVARKGGRIVTVSSVAGIAGNRGQVNYSASKAGIIGATKALAVELAKRGITVNCVAPGLVETEMIEAVPLAEALKAVPMQRVGKPEEVAAVVGFLCSDAASYVTRQVVSVNGGMI